ncbi:MAG: 4-(cytidine 5'-diphospho)-2-C-methyl-D-erythritol kinase [Eubacteriales bacterium]|nr:4-(cytidine 5'-diphospho)-2-C-methyl-D-erythritol kinase [Eubacteriales bacterium]
MNFLKELVCGKKVTVNDKAYAKINLYLNITDKRTDGYHDIESFMHSVDLYDELSVTVQMSDRACVSIKIDSDEELPTDKNNIAVLAAYAYMEWCRVKLDVEIRLKKNIPICAGLAGGSSDAASVLRCMNTALGGLVPISELAMIAGGIGSDVVYCLFGGTKLCKGRGDIITDVDFPCKLNVVIYNGGEKMPTPKMYGMLDDRYEDFCDVMNITAALKYSMISNAIKRGDLFDMATNMYNIFEEIVLENSENAKHARDIMLSSGAVGALVCGSGPSVFGIFANESDAVRVKNILGDNAVIAHSV